MIDVQVSSPVAGVRMLSLVGDIDMFTAPVVDSMITGQLARRPEALVLDLREVGFMSSAGLATLMSARNQAGAAGIALRVVCTAESVLRPMTITGLVRLFDVYSDVAAAIG